MVKRTLRVVAGVMLASIMATNSFASLTQSQRMADFQQLVSIIERNYGPLRWKEQTIGLNWRKHVETFAESAASAKSDREFYQILARFLSGLQDGHVSPMIPSTHVASLGFLCDLVEGKVLIEEIDRTRQPEALFPFKKGDQLLAIGGVPVETLMAELSWAAATGHKPSSDRITAARLTTRREARGVTVPKGNRTTVTVLPFGASQPVTIMTDWIRSGLPVIEQDDLSDLLERDSMIHVVQSASTSNIHDFLKDVQSLSLFNMKLPKAISADLAEIGIGDIGNPKPMFEGALPANFVRYNDGVLPIKTSITSGIFEAGGKTIGLIRIPAYDGSEVDPMDGLPILIKYLIFNVLAMESKVDVLMIDQTNNPGGAVNLLSLITSMFADKSFEDVSFKLRPSMGWVEGLSAISEQIDQIIKQDPEGKNADTALARGLQARFQNLEREVRDALVSKQFLTDPVSLNWVGGFGMIQPQPIVKFTKPILLLINEFDFSGGDAFPAIMKDNNRATLFGAQTSGAGGNVSEYGPLTNSHFKFSLTESLFMRPNGEYVENRGIKPDIEYKVTVDDFMNNYRGFLQAATREAVKLAGGNPEDATLQPPAAAPAPTVAAAAAQGSK